MMRRKVKVDTVLLCGGRGVRLAEVTGDKLPKSLYPVHGKELIQYTLDSLDMEAVGKLIFAVDHHDDKMVSWIYSQNLPCDVAVSRQTEPGIVGALRGASAYIKSAHFIICNTDEVRHNFSAKKFLRESMQVINSGTGTMATTISTDLFRHRTISTGPDGVIVNTQLKNQAYRESPGKEGMVNIGFLLLPKEFVGKIDDAHGNDWSSIIDPLVDQRKLFAVPFPNVRYFNVGTPAELNEAASFFGTPTRYPQAELGHRKVLQ